MAIYHIGQYTINLFILRAPYMAEINIEESTSGVQERLMEAAFNLFLEHDYNKVTTRQIAVMADTSLSMITYYFGDKQKLYNAMVRQQFQAIGKALEESYDEESGLDFKKLFLSYLEIHNNHPNFPAFLTKILAYKDGPGYIQLSEILDNKRDVIQKIITQCQNKNLISQHVDIDVLRIMMMSLSVFPFLIKGVLEHSKKMPMNHEVLEKVARLAGDMLQVYTQPEHDSAWLDLKK